jgi:Xaa-Pro dipeptidase
MVTGFGTRRAALRQRLRDGGLDGLLVTDLVNVRYLTGFTGSNAALLVGAGGEDGTVFCTDGRYLTQAAGQVPDLERVDGRASDLTLAERIDADRLGRVGFESHRVTVEQFDELTGRAGEAVGWQRAPGLVEALRAIKDGDEVAALRAACAAADHALAELIEAGGLRPGRTEREVALDLESRMREHGADGPSFETIVATGANSAEPHHRPTSATLRRGDLVKIDFGALAAGYHSDMTRTMVLGEPAGWQREIYELVARAQAAGRAALRPGAHLRDVDAAAREVIADAGYAEQFPHGLGHGVGLEIHEEPRLAATADGELAAGMAVTVEPGVYLPGRGGVRIEDILMVRDGEPELLTTTTKALLSV